MAATMTAGISLHQRYLTMSPDAVLAENAGNYAIDAAQVKSMKVKTGHFDDDDRTMEPNEIRVKWTGGKAVFKFKDLSAKEAKSLLRETFGSAVK
jgi:hypothetical protein